MPSDWTPRTPKRGQYVHPSTTTTPRASSAASGFNTRSRAAINRTAPATVGSMTSPRTPRTDIIVTQIGSGEGSSGGGDSAVGQQKRSDGAYDPSQGWLCDCSPPRRAARRVVKKQGANVGRSFLCCNTHSGAPADRRCGFWRWADSELTTEAEDAEIAAALDDCRGPEERAREQERFRLVRQAMHAAEGAIKGGELQRIDLQSQRSHDKFFNTLGARRAELQTNISPPRAVQQPPDDAVTPTISPQKRKRDGEIGSTSPTARLSGGPSRTTTRALSVGRSAAPIDVGSGSDTDSDDGGLLGPPVPKPQSETSRNTSSSDFKAPSRPSLSAIGATTPAAASALAKGRQEGLLTSGGPITPPASTQLGRLSSPPQHDDALAIYRIEHGASAGALHSGSGAGIDAGEMSDAGDDESVAPPDSPTPGSRSRPGTASRTIAATQAAAAAGVPPPTFATPAPAPALKRAGKSNGSDYGDDIPLDVADATDAVQKPRDTAAGDRVRVDGLSNTQLCDLLRSVAARLELLDGENAALRAKLAHLEAHAV